MWSVKTSVWSVKTSVWSVSGLRYHYYVCQNHRLFISFRNSSVMGKPEASPRTESV